MSNGNLSMTLEERRRAWKQAPQCPICNKRGLIIAEDSAKRTYTFRCSCEAAALAYPSFPVWSPSLATKYTITK